MLFSIIVVALAVFYRQISTALLRGEVALATLPIAVLVTFVSLYLFQPLTILIGKLLLFIFINLKVLFTKLLLSTLAVFVSALIPILVPIVTFLVGFALFLLSMGLIYSFYMSILNFLLYLLIQARNASNFLVSCFSSYGLHVVGLFLSIAFDILIVCYPAYIGFSSLIYTLFDHPSTVLENIVFNVSAIYVSLVTLRSFRLMTPSSNLDGNYYDPRDLIEAYL